MNNIYEMIVSKQYNSTTAFQFLKTAHVSETFAGTFEIFVKDKKGYEHIALVSDYNHLVISDVSGFVACLSMSDRTCNCFKQLEVQCAELIKGLEK